MVRTEPASGLVPQWAAMKLRLSFGDLRPEDLTRLDWSGGPEHLRAVAAILQAAYEERAALLVGRLANDNPVALGAAYLDRSPVWGLLGTLAVHEPLQGLGIGSALIGALERRVADSGRPRVRILVEQDNPRARVLYLRLGYREAGPALDHWTVAGGQTYVAACTVLERSLGEVPGSGRSAG